MGREREVKEERGFGFGFGSGFALLVVLFILLIIIGTAYTDNVGGYGDYCGHGYGGFY